MFIDRLSVRWLVPLALVLAAAVAPEGSRAAQLGGDFCEPGEVPAFHFGFLDLSSILGETMGAPVECEHPDTANGDTLQATTTGLAFYRASTNTPTFTDGFNHWALTSAGVLTWTGSSIDPPGMSPASTDINPPASAAPPELPPPSAPLGVWTSVSVQTPLQNPTQSFSTSFVPVPQYPYDNRLFRIDLANTSTARYMVEVSTTQGRTWDEVAANPQNSYPCPPNGVTLVLSPTFAEDSSMVLEGPTPCAISHDGGRTWNRFPERITSSYNFAGVTFSPTFASDHRLWLHGDVVQSGASVETSADGGATWLSVALPVVAATLQDFESTGSAAGRTLLLLALDDKSRTPSHRYFRSTDLGATWQEITEAFRDPETLAIPALIFRTGADSDHVYATPILYMPDSTLAWYSPDSGLSWRTVSDQAVQAVTNTGCAVLLGSTGLELSCNGAQVVHPATATDPRDVRVTKLN